MSKTDSYKETKEIDRNSELLSFYEQDPFATNGNVRFNACQLCKNVVLSTSLNDVSRLLRVVVRLVNCCPGKEITVGCIVTNRSGRILAYKSDTFIVSRDRVPSIETDNIILEDKNIDNCGCSGPCIDVRRAFRFILPVSDVCSPLDLNVKVIANYTSPCD